MSDAGASKLARLILQRMGTTGQPPERGARRVNVGTEHYLSALRDEYLAPIREAGLNSTFKLVQAPFGGGKTQFLHCLRELAWDEGFVTALVGVSPSECPFDEMPRIYQAVAQKLELPPADPLEEADTGIDAILRVAVERRREEASEEQVRQWIHEECARARVESHAVRQACVLFMAAVLDRDRQDEDLLRSYLRGERVTEAEVRPRGIREILEPATAFRFLRSLTQMLRLLDFAGVVLLFDEMDRQLSLSNKRRRIVGDNLRQVIDHCGQSSLPGVVWIYAVPPEFLSQVVPAYPALEQRLKGAARFAPQSPVAPIIDLDALPLEPAELLVRIGARLFELHLEAWPDRPLDVAIQRRNIALLARELGEQQLESGTRRTFVKAAVQMLVEQSRSPQRLLEPNEISTLAGTRGGAGVVAPMEGEDVFA